MPKGETSRPYSKTEKKLAAVKKKLQNATRNASINAEERAAAKKYKQPDRATNKRGAVMGISGNANDASSMMRAIGADTDKRAAAAIRAKKKQKR